MILWLAACAFTAEPLVEAAAVEAAAVEAAPVEAASTLVVEAPRVLLEDSDVVLEQQAWTFGSSKGVAWRVKLPRDAALDIVPADSVVRLDTLVPDDKGPWAAINGGFYERGPMGLVVSEGQRVADLESRGGSGIVQWGPEPVSVIHRDKWVDGPTEALQSIDRLVDGGLSLVNRRDGARAASRSAVAVSAEHVWFVVLVDGRSLTESAPGGEGGGSNTQSLTPVQLTNTVSLGLPLWAFAEYLVEHTGAQQALNLDGAISTQLEVSAGGERFSVRGQAGTINALVARPAVREVP